MKQVLLLGAGGHAKGVIGFLKHSYEILGLIEKDYYSGEGLISSVPVIGTDKDLKSFYQKGITNALVTVGSTGDSSLRERLFYMAKEIGFTMINAIHPTAVISEDVKIGCGNTFMAGTIINSGTVIGDNTIINTGAIVDHDCIVEDHTHIAPGVKIAGGVFVGEGTHVGIGAVVIQGIHIGRKALIGAGTVVLRDIPDNAVVVGVPGRVKKYR